MEVALRSTGAPAAGVQARAALGLLHPSHGMPLFPGPGGVDDKTLGLAIGLPVGVLVMALLGLVVLWRRASTRRSLLTGGVLAPKAGDATTLVVTDVQVRARRRPHAPPSAGLVMCRCVHSRALCGTQAQGVQTCIGCASCMLAGDSAMHSPACCTALRLPRLTTRSMHERHPQDSTALWELLPEPVMDAALRLHHTIIRKALLKHAGYESATGERLAGRAV
jgi:hypothetical protein